MPDDAPMRREARRSRGFVERNLAWLIGAVVTALIGAVVAIIVGWTGIGDWRPFCDGFRWCLTPSDGSTASDLPKELSPDSPVTVTWTGGGDTVLASWAAQDYPDLAHYYVQVTGLYPMPIEFDPGYRIGQELETSREINPPSEAIARYRENGDEIEIPSDETWQICVTAMRETPGGVDITPYIIQGSERCSDPFVIPSDD